MSDRNLLLLSGGISLLTAILTTIITTRITYNSDRKKEIHSQRLDLYLEIYDHIELLLRKRETVFDREFFETLIKLKPKMKLLSSKNTVEEYETFYNAVRDYYHRYLAFQEENDPELNGTGFYTWENEDGEEITEPAPNFEILLNSYNIECNRFICDNKPTPEILSSLISSLCESMRKELGSNL